MYSSPQSRGPEMGGESDTQSRREAGVRPDATSQRRVVALVAREEDRREVREVLGSSVELHFCSRSSELFHIASEIRPHVIVADPVDIDGRSPTAAIQSLKAASPLLQVVYCMDLSARAVRSAMEGWATGIVIRHQEELGATLRTALTRAPRAGSPGPVLATTSRFVPAELRRYFTYCAWNAIHIRHVRDAARDVGIRYRTLAHWFRVAGLPPPKEVLDWFRFLHAAWRVEQTHENRETIAKESGFSAGYHMARRLRLYTGLTWTALHDRVGFDGLLMMFEKRLRAQAATRAASEKGSEPRRKSSGGANSGEIIDASGDPAASEQFQPSRPDEDPGPAPEAPT